MTRIVTTLFIMVCMALSASAQTVDTLHRHKADTPQTTAKSNAAVTTTKSNAAATTTKSNAAATGATAKPHATATPQHHPSTATTRTVDDEMNIPTVDLRKKVMRRSYKVNGYRVQAYSGGNKRTDKVRAQQIGNAIKMAYPDQPVYVHFYSPRWICRVGNYRTYAEAQRMLKAVKKMGYKSAMIVKGKITVQY